MNRVKELDGLRAIAILAVLLSHYTPADYGVSGLLYLGWSGVDLFFAISGFLITAILLNLRQRQAPFRTFYGRRTLRIFPPYYLVLILLVFAAVIHKENVNYRLIIRHALFLSSATPGLIKLVFLRLICHVCPASPPYHPFMSSNILNFSDCLGVYWSLSVEEIFYLIWGSVILKGTRRLIIICSVTPLLLCPVLRGLAHTSPHIDETVGFLFRFDSLAAGGCIALLFHGTQKGYLPRKFLDRALIPAMMVSALVLFLLTMSCGIFHGVDVRATLAFSVFGYSLLAILCASVVGACVHWKSALGPVSRILCSKPADYLGTRSYTMYLVHLPAFAFVQMACFKWLAQNPVAAAPALVVVCGVFAMAGTIGLAALSWKYFEKPILRLKDRQFPVRIPPRSTPSVMQAANI